MQNKQDAKTTVHLSTTCMIAFALPNFVSSLYGFFVNLHLTKFYLEDATPTRLSPVQYGLLTSLIGSLGLFIDFFISYLVDFVHFKYQSNLPFLLFGAPIVAIAELALFAPPAFDSAFYLGVWFLLFSILKNMVPLGLSYNALGPKLTSKATSEQRDQLFAMKHWFGLVGSLLGSFLPYLVSHYFGSGNHKIYATFAAVLMVLSYWILAYFARPFELLATQIQKNTSKQTEAIPLIVGMKMAFANKGFLAVLCMFLFDSARGLLWNNTYSLYMLYVLQLNGDKFEFWTGTLNTVGTIMALVATPFWVRLAKRIGNYNTWLLCYGLCAPVGIFVYMFVYSYDHIYRYIAFAVFLDFVGRGSGFVFDAVKANVINYDELLTGQRREASLESCWGLFPRYVSLPGSIISMKILESFGNYDSTKTYEQQYQNRQLVNTISIQAALLPSLTGFIAWYLIYKFPVNDKVHEQVKYNLDLIQQGKDALDPITMKKVVARTTDKQDNTQELHTLGQFFTFELKPLRNKNKLLWEYVFCTLGLSLALLLFGMFTYGSLTIQLYNEQSAYFGVGKNTAYLWISSVCFAWGMFHFLRIKPTTTMLQMPQAQIDKYVMKQ